jgi:hypothetical protein
MDAITAGSATLALAGVVGGLTEWSRRRRRAKRTAGVFRCRVRAAGAGDGARTWPRRSITARWVHDVLVFEWGPMACRRRALGVRAAFGVLEANRALTSDEGDVSLRFELDDGSAIHVSTDETAADALGGPFLCAHPILRRTPRA